MKKVPLNIVADENMAMVPELFGRFGTVTSMPGRAISNRDLVKADALLVRSVTRVDAQLLAGSPVQFVGSATIGTDHIDLDYLQQKGIQFHSAPGCNANAVVNYVIAALCSLEPDWRNRIVAILGCGNVGGRLYRCLRGLGVRCLCYDPFLKPEVQTDLVPFSALFDADIFCLHTPLTTVGAYPTHHMFSRSVLERLKPNGLVVNAGRGPVIDNLALKSLLESGRELRVVLDVWEAEPDIDLELLELVCLGTPHIAGYSVEGKVNGSHMICAAMSQWLGCPTSDPPTLPRAGTIQLAPTQGLAEAVLAAYRIGADHQRMRTVLTEPGDDGETTGMRFDRLRKEYPQRREFTAFDVVSSTGADFSDELLRQLSAVGFRLQ